MPGLADGPAAPPAVRSPRAAPVVSPRLLPLEQGERLGVSAQDQRGAPGDELVEGIERAREPVERRVDAVRVRVGLGDLRRRFAADARFLLGALGADPGCFELRLRTNSAGFALPLSLELGRELPALGAHLVEDRRHVLLRKRHALDADLLEGDAVAAERQRPRGAEELGLDLVYLKVVRVG